MQSLINRMKYEKPSETPSPAPPIYVSAALDNPWGHLNMSI